MDYIKRDHWNYVLATCQTCKLKTKEIRIDQWNRAKGSWRCRSCSAVEMHVKNPHVSAITKHIHTVHGDAKNKYSKGHWLYGRWQKMKRRCKEYHSYIAKGIQVCDEWIASYPAFKKWAEENGADQALELDRTNNHGNYCPENCRWVTHQVNCRNR